MLIPFDHQEAQPYGKLRSRLNNSYTTTQLTHRTPPHQFVETFVRSRLDYCNGILSGISSQSLKSLKQLDSYQGQSGMTTSRRSAVAALATYERTGLVQTWTFLFTECQHSLARHILPRCFSHHARTLPPPTTTSALATEVSSSVEKLHGPVCRHIFFASRK